jgi:hypothetical protein
MVYRRSIGALALVALMYASCVSAQAFDQTRYPD